MKLAGVGHLGAIDKRLSLTTGHSECHGAASTLQLTAHTDRNISNKNYRCHNFKFPENLQP